MNAYARKTGVSSQRLRWWRNRLGEWAPAERQSPEAGELTLVPMLTQVEAVHVGRASATLHLPGGVVLEFDAGQVPAAWVAEVALAIVRAR